MATKKKDSNKFEIHPLKIFTILDDSLKDNVTGQYSHARIIAMLVAFAATVFIWKLIILGGMTVEYFICYCAYGTGHQTLNKFLDNRNGFGFTPIGNMSSSPSSPPPPAPVPAPPPAPVAQPTPAPVPPVAPAAYPGYPGYVYYPHPGYPVPMQQPQAATTNIVITNDDNPVPPKKTAP